MHKSITVDIFVGTVEVRKVKDGYDVVMRVPFITKEEARREANRIIRVKGVRLNEKVK